LCPHDLQSLPNLLACNYQTWHGDLTWSPDGHGSKFGQVRAGIRVKLLTLDRKQVGVRMEAP